MHLADSGVACGETCQFFRKWTSKSWVQVERHHCSLAATLRPRRGSLSLNR